MVQTPFELTPKQKSFLQALSQETGKPISDLIEEALKGLRQPRLSLHSGTTGNPVQNGESYPPPPAASRKPIWELFEEASHNIPDEELDRLPTDGSYQHDHYIYGTPKRPT